jgi:hypothetical protein
MSRVFSNECDAALRMSNAAAAAGDATPKALYLLLAKSG